MIKTFLFGLILFLIPLVSSADVIYLKNGEKIEAPDVWEENGWVKYKVSGIEVSFPKDEVERVEKRKVERVEKGIIKIERVKKRKVESDKTPSSLAKCWVSGETQYSSDKELMATWVDLFFKQRKTYQAGRMINKGIIKQTHWKPSWISCAVLGRDGDLVNVDISGIGNVWVYHTYVFCGGKRLENRLDQ